MMSTLEDKSIIEAVKGIKIRHLVKGVKVLWKSATFTGFVVITGMFIHSIIKGHPIFTTLGYIYMGVGVACWVEFKHGLVTGTIKKILTNVLKS